MLKLNNDKLFYAIKMHKDREHYCFTRSYEDDITEDKTILAGGIHEMSAWCADSPSRIMKDLKSCGFNEFDQLKAAQYMGIK